MKKGKIVYVPNLQFFYATKEFSERERKHSSKSHLDFLPVSGHGSIILFRMEKENNVNLSEHPFVNHKMGKSLNPHEWMDIFICEQTLLAYRT